MGDGQTTAAEGILREIREMANESLREPWYQLSENFMYGSEANLRIVERLAVIRGDLGRLRAEAIKVAAEIEPPPSGGEE